MRELLHDALLGLVASIFILAYLFPYFYLEGIWWRAIPSTAVMFVLGAAVSGHATLRVFGLRMSAQQAALSVGVFLGLLPLASLVLFRLVVVEPLSAQTAGTVLSRTHQLFQVLNDEIVLRAVLLGTLVRAAGHPKAIVLLTALAFSFGHYVVYRLGAVQVEWPALASLFSFGVIANCLFLWSRHIGYGLALHFAWNLLRFDNVYYLAGRPLSEGATFNYIEGNAWIASTSLAGAALLFGSYMLSTRARGAASESVP